MAGTYEITVTTSVAASHRLRGYRGKCEQLHGHNYRVEATVATAKLDAIGLAVDFKVLKERLHRVVDRFDHTDLNACAEFCEVNPSSENMARVICEGLQAATDDLGVRVARVRVYETEGNCATYIP